MDVAQGLGEPRYIGLFLCVLMYSLSCILTYLFYVSCTMNDFDHIMVNKLFNGYPKGGCY